MGQPKLNRVELKALEQAAAAGGPVPSTNSAFRELAKHGYVKSLGLIVASMSSRGATLKQGYRITRKGRALLARRVLERAAAIVTGGAP